MLKQLDVLIGFAAVMSLVSLLITVITQWISSALDLRGKNLLSALEAMFRTLRPDLKDAGKNKAFALADAILRHPIISDSSQSGNKRTLASAIRPEELLSIIEKIAADSTNQAALIGKMGTIASVSALTKTKAVAGQEVTTPEIAEAARAILDALRQPSKSVADSVSALTGAIGSLSDPNVKQSALDSLKALQATASAAGIDAMANTEKWLNTVEDRSRAWFSTHTQIVSGSLALIFAIALQLDVFDLYQRLGSDDKLRADLVANAGSLEVELAKIQDQANAATNKPNSAMTAGKAADSTNKFDLPWAATQKAMSNVMNQINLTSKKTGFEIIPEHQTWGDWWNGLGHHCSGIICAALLLSLGSPFWFNLLKDFTGLRSALAKQVDKDDDNQTDQSTKKQGT